MKVYCTLTKEQASLYAAVVEDADDALEERRGHPAQGAGPGHADEAQAGLQPPGAVPGRQLAASPAARGKLARLTEMLEEVLAAATAR